MALSADDLPAMVAFARVVESGSFTEAARRLGLAKSVVSVRVSALERCLGVRLLQRSTRRLSLTEEGTRVYGQCVGLARMLDDTNATLEHAEGEPAGTLRVSANA